MISSIKNGINQAKEVTAFFKSDYILVISKLRVPTLYSADELTERRIRELESLGFTVIYFFYVRKQVVMSYKNNKSSVKVVDVDTYLRFEDSAIKVNCSRNKNSVTAYYRYGGIKAENVKTFISSYLKP